MTPEDKYPDDDARFDAFLRNEDSLAHLLQSIAQPTPSAALDAAIFADAEAALASDPAPCGAANDPILPGARPLRRSFAARWSVPLGLAATVLVASSLVWMQHAAGPVSYAPVQIAAAPAPVAAPTAPTDDHRSDARGDNEKTTRTEMPAAPRARNQTAVAADEPHVVAAQGGAVAAAPAEMTAPADVRRTSPEATADAEAKTASNVLAQAGTPAPAGALRRSSPFASAAPSADMPAPDRAKAMRPLSDAQDEAMGTAMQAAGWLKKIEEKIDAGSRRDALDEWIKFRKIYPDYDVPKRILEKIDALKKASEK